LKQKKVAQWRLQARFGMHIFAPIVAATSSSVTASPPGESKSKNAKPAGATAACNPQEVRDQVLSAYPERPSIRGPERTFGINCLTITSWIKKPKSRGYGLACVGARAKSWPMPWAGAAQRRPLLWEQALHFTERPFMKHLPGFFVPGSYPAFLWITLWIACGKVLESLVNQGLA
jgi:hypothetical protein